MISVELLKFLRDWLGINIPHADKKIGESLANAGVK